MSGSKLSFFRQSGWLVIASTASGALMYAVHKFAGKMPKAEYGGFTALLQVLNLMSIPAAALQTVFAQQTAAAVSDEDRRQLRGTMRAVLAGTFVLWLLMAGGVLLATEPFMAKFKLSNPGSVWAMVGFGLCALWLPVLTGVLQGAQNFLWFGWTSIINGLTRFLSVVLIVLVLGHYAAGAMTGAMIGMIIGIALSAWQTRKYWTGETAPMNWRGWFKRILPLTFGLGATTFMLSADMIVVQSHFPEDTTAFYAAAGMIGRALIFFTAPLTAVMFPKIVQSAARSEKTDVLAQALGVTALMGLAAAVGCTLFPTLPLRVIYDETFLAASGPLVPWFAWCMLPLTLAIVLINNLLARQHFEVVPWLVIITVGYGCALNYFHQSFLAVVQTLGIFSFLQLAAATWFTWRKR